MASRSEIYSFYLDDPKDGMIEKELQNTKIKYFYFTEDLEFETQNGELLNGCLLAGSATILFEEKTFELNQFDIFFLPPRKKITIRINPQSNTPNKICVYYYNIDTLVEAEFDLQHFDLNKFIPRGESGSEKKMATYRTVWTAIKNKYFMSGFTNIPNEALKQGVITSVNLEENHDGNIEIYPHIHPEYPEIYIMCIDDLNYSISQYLINTEGHSVIKDLKDGEGLFFPGNLAHSNFSRPFYKELKFCMYLWIIPTFGRVDAVSPITLKV